MPKWLLVMAGAAGGFTVLAGALYFALRPRPQKPREISAENHAESEDHHEFASQVHESGGSGGHGAG